MPLANQKTVARAPAFTLVEVMIVVAVIALLAVIALPNFLRARGNAMNARYAADMRVVSTAFIQYDLDLGHYPPDSTPAVMPAGMDEYLKRVRWTKPDALGGLWDWDYKQFGTTAGVSSYQPTASVSQLRRYDALVDDGNLSTGGFHARENGYISVIEP